MPGSPVIFATAADAARIAQRPTRKPTGLVASSACKGVSWAPCDDPWCQGGRRASLRGEFFRARPTAAFAKPDGPKAKPRDPMSDVSVKSASDDRREIRELLENWVVWRDAGDWQRFRSVWHADGVMMATWFQARLRNSSECRKRAGTRG